MSDSILEISHKHGRQMYLIGIEHAVSILEALNDVGETVAHLNRNIANEKREIEALDHSRFNEDHRKSCDDCRDAYGDFVQEENQNGENDNAN